MRRSLPAAVVIWSLGGAEALAHAADRGFVMLLPTGYYLAGGAAAVAISFVVLVLVRFPSRPPQDDIPLLLTPGSVVPGWASLLFCIELVVLGMAGSRDPLYNPLTLTVWTLWWVALPLLLLLTGDIWRSLNPWSGPYRLLSRATGGGALADFPQWLGAWPAVAGFLAFAWFELVYPAPSDPARLAFAATLYWMLIFAAMMVWGEAVVLDRVECFSIFFRYLGRLSPFAEGAGFLPGRALVRTRPPSLSVAVLILLILSSVSFDGFSKTFLWLGLIGVNPLEFPGRSALMVQNTVGLIALWALLSLACVAAMRLGWMLAGRGAPFRRFLTTLVLSIIPIAIGYHLAHYLTVLLVNGQYLMLAANDPLFVGQNLFGVSDYRVTTSFLTNLGSVEVIWRIQAGAIVLGHLAGVALAHLMAQRIWPDRRSAMLSQIPLAALMVGYTLFGLWLLSTPVAA